MKPVYKKSQAQTFQIFVRLKLRNSLKTFNKMVIFAKKKQKKKRQLENQRIREKI